MKNISEAISTISERELLFNFLDQLEVNFYKKDFDVKTIIKNVPQGALEPLLATFSHAIFMGSKALNEAIENLRHELKEMQIVTITVSIEPTNELSLRLKQWFLKETDQNVLLDFKVDQNLIGGAVIESSGFRTEYSFRKYFLLRKEKN